MLKIIWQLDVFDFCTKEKNASVELYVDLIGNSGNLLFPWAIVLVNFPKAQVNTENLRRERIHVSKSSLSCSARETTLSILTGLFGKCRTSLRIILYVTPLSSVHSTDTSPQPSGRLLSPLTAETEVEAAALILRYDSGMKAEMSFQM